MPRKKKKDVSPSVARTETVNRQGGNTTVVESFLSKLKASNYVLRTLLVLTSFLGNSNQSVTNLKSFLRNDQ